MELEGAFAAGGRLLSGSDPTGSGDALSGFCDRRETELLVEAGFSRMEAIKIPALKGRSTWAKTSSSARSRLVRMQTWWSSSHASPDIMRAGEWEWLRCPRKCPRSEVSAFIPTGFLA